MGLQLEIIGEGLEKEFRMMGPLMDDSRGSKMELKRMLEDSAEKKKALELQMTFEQRLRGAGDSRAVIYCRNHGLNVSCSNTLRCGSSHPPPRIRRWLGCGRGEIKIHRECYCFHFCFAGSAFPLKPNSYPTMKLLFSFLLASFVLFAPCIAQDSLGGAQKESREAERAIPDGEAEEVDDEGFDEEDFDDDFDFDDIDDIDDWDEASANVTEGDVKKMIEAEFKEIWDWAETLEDEEYGDEIRQWISEEALDAVLIKDLRDWAFKEYVAMARAELNLDRWEYELFEGDLADKLVGAELIKAKKEMNRLMIRDLRREILSLETEIEDLEDEDPEAEVREMLDER